jgi:hypothetical protein
MTANYVRLVKRISDDMPFPNWRRVIPEKEKTVLLYNELLVDCKELQDSLYAMYRTGVKIKTRYMTDLDANNEKQIWSVRQTPCDKKSALLFESGNRMAVIMPMSEVSKIAYPLDAAVKLAVKNGDVPDSIAERMDMSVADVMAIIGDTATPEPVMPEIVPVIEPEPVVETAPVMKEESATPETAPEQPKRKPRRIEAMIERHTTRRSAEQTPERGVWTPNRTGTKQILVCKW